MILRSFISIPSLRKPIIYSEKKIDFQNKISIFRFLLPWYQYHPHPPYLYPPSQELFIYFFPKEKEKKISKKTHPFPYLPTFLPHLILVINLHSPQNSILLPSFLVHSRTETYSFMTLPPPSRFSLSKRKKRKKKHLEKLFVIISLMVHSSCPSPSLTQRNLSSHPF